jgi:putative transposase
MVRAGVVAHPSEWASCGYNEIQKPRERYALIDYGCLRSLFDFRSMYDFAEAHRGWVEKSLEEEILSRDQKWTESVAVGSEKFVEATKEKLSFKAKGREVIGADGSYQLQESPTLYKGNLGLENEPLRLQNEYFWEDSV